MIPGLGLVERRSTGESPGDREFESHPAHHIFSNLTTAVQMLSLAYLVGFHSDFRTTLNSECKF